MTGDIEEDTEADQEGTQTSPVSRAATFSTAAGGPADTLRQPPRAQWKQQILDDFAAWLDALDEPPAATEEDAGNKQPDLETLLAEFTALRQEVRLQSRSGNKLGEQVENLSADLSEKLDAVNRVSAAVQEELPKTRKETKKQVVKEVLEVIEAAERSLHNAEAPSLPRILLRPGARQKAREKLARPVQLLNTKIEDMTRRLGLEKTAAPGMPFDPETMRAVSSTNSTLSGESRPVVSQVLRAGYRLDGEVIQTAEVKVEQ